MAIIQNYMTKNPCYKESRIIAVKGLMLHSVGCPQPNPEVFIRNWNKESFDSACVHGFIGENDAHITLPILTTPGYAVRGWHGGRGKNGNSNDYYIGVEMCEPKWIKYVGGATFTCSNVEESRKYVEKTTRNAVQLFAKLCAFHGLDPLKDGVIISHYEGNLRGIACNHADPDHLWRQLNMDYNMDRFRRDVFQEVNRIKGKEEDEDMTKEQFKQMWHEMRLDLQDNDAGDWSKEAREWAVKNDIIRGTSNQEFNGAWEDLMTREQLVTVLYRFAQLMGKV